MARFYDSSRRSDPSQADRQSLNQQVALAFNWSATDAARQLGGTRQLALGLLEMKGKEVTKTSIASEMRNVNRYIKAESGTGGQVRHPSKAAQKVINKLASEDKLKKDGHKRPAPKIKKPGAKGSGRGAGGSSGGGGGGNVVTVSITGTVSVNGYEDDRDIDIYLNEDELDDFLDNPSYETLSEIWGADVFLIDGSINFDY